MVVTSPVSSESYRANSASAAEAPHSTCVPPGGGGDQARLARWPADPGGFLRISADDNELGIGKDRDSVSVGAQAIQLDEAINRNRNLPRRRRVGERGCVSLWRCRVPGRYRRIGAALAITAGWSKRDRHAHAHRADTHQKLSRMSMYSPD